MYTELKVQNQASSYCQLCIH